MTETWPKQLTVDKRIISTLSTSTYENFPQALKELVVNSYDADATQVNIDIDIENEIISLHDTGKGMSEEDFDFYLRIAGKSRRKTDLTEGGRQIVGKFGVGFLAVFPFCKTYQIETTKKGNPYIVKATIDCEKYFNIDEESISDVDSVPIFGGVEESNSYTSQSFTKILLVGFASPLRAFLQEKYKTSKKSSISAFSPVELIKWTLCEYLPIKYKEDKLNQIFKLNDTLPFTVKLNAEVLYRNNHLSEILETHSGNYEQEGDIKFRFVIGTQWKAIQPAEARYIFIRNRNVGVGDRSTFGIGLDGRLYSRLAWLSIDVDIVEGMNDLIAVSRDKFNFSPDFERFKDFFRKKLREWATNLEQVNDLQKLLNSKKDRIDTFSTEIEDRKEQLISSLEKKGVEVKIANAIDKPSSEFLDQPKYTHRSSDNIKVKKPRKNTPKNKPESIEKTVIEITRNSDDSHDILELNGKRLIVVFDKWKKDPLYPVCRIDENKIIVNEEARILKHKNYRDLFIKFFAIIADNHQMGTISRSVAVSMNNQALALFKNY